MHAKAEKSLNCIIKKNASCWEFKEYEFRKWFNPSWLYISFQINSDLSLQIAEPATDQLLTWFLENDKVSLYRRKKFWFPKSSMSFIAEMRKNLQQLAVLSVMQFRKQIFQLWHSILHFELTLSLQIVEPARYRRKNCRRRLWMVPYVNSGKGWVFT